MNERTELLTTEELALVLAVSTSTLKGWRRKEVGPAYVRLGSLVRYDRAEVERWMRTNSSATRGQAC